MTLTIKPFSLVLLFLIVFSILPLTVHAQETTYRIEISVDNPYYLRGESVNVTVTTNSSSPTVQIFDPSMNLIYDQVWTGNESRFLPVSLSASYGTYTVKGLVVNGTCETWFTVLDVTGWTLASFPHVKEHKGLTYTFYSNWTFTISNPEDSLLVDMTKIRELKNQFDLDVTALQNSMNFLVRFSKGTVFSMDLAFSFIHIGCKFIVNGTMDQPRDITFQFASPRNVMKYLDSLKSGNIVFDFSDIRRTGHIFSYDPATKLLTVSLPQSFRLDPVIFEDGFESGDFSAWSTSGTCNIIESPVHHGTYSANVTGYFYKSGLTATSDAFGRCYVYLQVEPPSGVNYIITKMYDSGWGSDYVGVIVTNDSGVIKFGLDLASGNYYNDTEVFINTWYCIEYERDVTLGDARLWVDGVLWLEDTSETMAGDTVTFMGTSGDVVTWAVISDCYVFDSSYIGVEAEGGQDLTFNLFQNFLMYGSFTRSLVLSRSMFDNVQLHSSSSMGIERGFSLYENLLLYGSASRGLEIGRSLFENIVIYGSSLPVFELGVLDLVFTLFGNVGVIGSSSIGRELGFSLYENVKLWSSITSTFQGIAQDLTFTLFETVQVWAGIATVLAQPYVLNDALLLAGFAMIIAFVAIALVFVVKRND